MKHQLEYNKKKKNQNRTVLFVIIRTMLKSKKSILLT